MKCYNCYNSQLDTHSVACNRCGALTHPPTVTYFYVHPLRFLLLSFITAGFFVPYWFYRNWVAVKQAEKTSIRPFWRALFYTYFCFNLFTRIYGDAKARDYKSRLTASKLIIFYVVSTYLFNSTGNIAQYMSVHTLFPLLFIVMAGIGFLLVLCPLLFIQPAIKFHNAHAMASHEHNASDPKNKTIPI